MWNALAACCAATYAALMGRAGSRYLPMTVSPQATPVPEAASDVDHFHGGLEGRIAHRELALPGVVDTIA
jgi:hypothetical protein